MGVLRTGPVSGLEQLKSWCGKNAIFPIDKSDIFDGCGRAD